MSGASPTFTGLLRGGMGRDIAETLSTRALQVGLGLITSVLVARSLGVSGRGEFALAMSVAALLAQFGNLGLHASNTYLLARDSSTFGSLYANTLVVGVGLGSLLGSVALATRWLAPELLPLGWPVASLVAIWVPIGLYTLLGQHLLLGSNRVRPYNASELGQRIATTILIALLIVGGAASPASLVAAGLSGLLLGAMVISRAALQAVDRGAVRPSRTMFRSSLRYGLKAYAANLAAFLLLRIDLLMVGAILPLSQTGLYSIATAMIDLFQILPAVVGTLLFPRMAALDDPRSRWILARSGAVTVGILMSLLAVVAWLLADWAITFLYGVEFAGAASSFVILLPGTVLLSANIILNNYLAASGMPPVAIIGPFLGVLANVALNAVLTPVWGITGAATASSIAYGSMLAVNLWALHRSPALRGWKDEERTESSRTIGGIDE